MAKSDKAKTFKQCRDEWMGAGKSDNINYCMPVNIGIIAQDSVPFDKGKVRVASETIINTLSKWFGKFKTKNKTNSHNQLILMIRNGDSRARFMAGYLKEHYNADIEIATEQDIKQYCWVTIAAWDGIPSQAKIYSTIKDILSTKISVGDDYRLRFPENRPVFQIVLPDGKGNSPEMDYSIREIYPHMLETIDKPEPWFSRNKFQTQTWLDKRRDSKRRNFIANATKLKKFNKKITRFSRKIDNQTQNVYDLIPWQHFHAKYKKSFDIPDYVNIANLREIFYDVVSMKAQKSEDSQAKILLTLAAVGLGSFVMYSDSPFDRPVLLFFFLLFVICMSAAYLIYLFRVVFSGSHKTYLEFRALAEGMRVQCYWYAIGLNQSVGDKYTVKFQKDMQWAKQAFNAWFVSDYLGYHFSENTTTQTTTSNQAKSLQRNKMVKAEWLGTLKHSPESEPTKQTVLPDELSYYSNHPLAGTEEFSKDLETLKKALGKEEKMMPGGQYGYFYKTTRNWGEKDGKGKLRSRLTLGIWIVSAILLMVFVTISSPLEDYFVCLMGICATLPLTFTGWSSIKAYGELASKYSYCELLAEKALQDYSAAEKESENNAALLKNTLKIFEQYGIEALEENAEWLMIKNDREPTVPNG